MIASILYVLSFILIFTAVTLYPRKSNPISFFSWIPINLMLVLCYQGLIGEIFSIIGIPINIIIVSITNIIAGAILLLLIKAYGRQSFNFDIVILASFLVLVGITIHIGLDRFSTALIPNFVSVDGASHLGFANRYIFEGKPEINLLLSGLTESLWMRVFMPITGEFYTYKAYLIVELVFLFLAGAIFISVISHLLKTIPMKIIGLFFTLFYFFGYPLNSFEFGFSYHGLSITVIALILFLVREWMEEDVNKTVYFVAIMLGLNGLFLTYTFLVPAIFVGVFMAFLVYQKENDKIICKNTFFLMLKVFLIPSVLGLLVSFKNLMFLSASASVAGGSNGIATDGGCYNNIYSNFVLLFPFVIIGLWALISNGRIFSPYVWTTFVMLGFTGVLFAFGMKGKVSVYYYVKTSNVLWLLFIVLLLYAMDYILENLPVCAIAGTLMFALLLAALYIDVDVKIAARNSRYFTTGVDAFLNVHAWNKVWYEDTYVVSPLQIELYRYIYEHTDYRSKECISVGDQYFTVWAYRMTSQELGYNAEISPEDIEEYIEPETKYIMYQNTKNFENEKKGWYELGEVVFGNEFGGVICLDR